jgi:hypothetical protein
MNKASDGFLSPWLASAVIHVLPAAVLAAIYFWEPSHNSKRPTEKVVSFEMIKSPPKPQPVTEIKASAKPQPKPEPQKPAKRVFGLRRDSLTTESDEGETVKQGNTLQKEDEGQVLEENDPTALPVPEKEYLITQMPSVLKKNQN